jgi:hypothetical protein
MDRFVNPMAVFDCLWHQFRFQFRFPFETVVGRLTLKSKESSYNPCLNDFFGGTASEWRVGRQIGVSRATHMII